MDNLLDEISPNESETAAYIEMRKGLRVTQASMLVVLAVLMGYFLWAMSYLVPEIRHQMQVGWNSRIPRQIFYPVTFLLICFGVLVYFLLRGLFSIQLFCNAPDANGMAKVLGWQNKLFFICILVTLGFPLLVYYFDR